MELKFYLSLFLRRLHWFVLVVVLGSAAAIWIARGLPTTFVAESTLVVEREQIPDNLASSTVQIEAQEQIQLLRQRVLARDMLIEMANRLDIYADRRASGAPALDGDSIVRDLRERISISTNNVSLAQRRVGTPATILTISFSAPEPQLAANVTNEIVTLMLRENATIRTGAARQTLEFFEQEVMRLDQELARRAAMILEFQQNNLRALPDSLDFQRNQLGMLQERLFQLDRQEAELTDRRERLVRLESLADENAPVANMEATPQGRQLRQLLDERTALLAVLSPENPRIRSLSAQIEALEAIVGRQTSDAQSIPGEPARSPTQAQIDEIDAQLGALVRQKDQIRSEMTQLEANIQAIPSNSIQLDSLQREYAATQAQYNLAISNRARAETGDTIEAMARGQRITIIDPAVAPLRPTSPNRPLIIVAGIAGSVAFGIALVVLIEIMRPGIRRPADLSRALGITPFATLPYMRTRGEVLRGRVLAWGGLCVALLLIFGGLWAVDTYYMPLDIVFDRARALL